MNSQIPPNDQQIEKALLGLALLNNKHFQPQIPEEAYYRTGHQLVVRAITSLISKGEPADISTVTAWLRTQGLLEKAGGAATVAELTSHGVSPGNVEHYAQTVLEHASRRTVISEAITVIGKAYARESVDELSADLHSAGNMVAPKSNRAKGIREILSSYIERLENLHGSKDTPGISTGFQKVDEITRLHPEKLTIVAGRPGMGKTGLALNMITSALFDGHSVFMASVEMNHDGLAQRFLSALSGIDGEKFNTADFERNDWGKLMGALGRLADTNLVVDDSPRVSSAQIRAGAHRMVEAGKRLGLVVVDYAQRVREPGFSAGDKRLEMGEVSSNMVALAKELNTHVILLAQLNRDVDKRVPPIPKISDLKETGDFEQDADNIILLFRPEYYKKDKTPPEDIGIGQIIIGKCRSGRTGSIKVQWDGPTTSFRPLATGDRWSV
jgi:replicative DNA helicase